MAPLVPVDYPQEFLHWMFMKENSFSPYRRASPQFHMRGSLVEFIRKVCEALKLSILTTYLGVALLDRFMDAHSIPNSQLRLTALAVIFLAAKFEEIDCNIPKLSHLNAFANNRYSMRIFNLMEAFMLNFFEWNVGMVTSAHFLEYFLIYGMSPKDRCSPDTHRELWFASHHYLDVSLQDSKFLTWKCSRLAASSFACGRLYCKFSQVWPFSLELATGYSYCSILTMVKWILRLSGSKINRDIDFLQKSWDVNLVYTHTHTLSAVESDADSSHESDSDSSMEYSSSLTPYVSSTS